MSGLRYVSGDCLRLHMAEVYAEPEGGKPTKQCSGTFYLWGDPVAGKRYPIATTRSRCGLRGHIYGWVDEHIARDALFAERVKQIRKQK